MEHKPPLSSLLYPIACRRARVRQGQAFGGAKEAPSLTDVPHLTIAGQNTDLEGLTAVAR
jgi:hypothetical protein